MTYEIEFKNSRPSPLSVFDRDGAKLLSLDAGEVASIFTDNPNALWARWKRVNFVPQAPWVALEERGIVQQPPEGDVFVEFMNIGDGAAVEYRVTADGQPLVLMKGVPVRMAIPSDTPDAEFSEVRVAERFTERVPSVRHQGVFEYQPVLRDTRRLRVKE